MIPSRPRTWQRSPRVPSSRWPGARLSGLPGRGANAHKLVRQPPPNHRRLERPAPSRQTVGEITEDTKGQRRQRDLTEGARDSDVRKPSGAREEVSSPSRPTSSSGAAPQATRSRASAHAGRTEGTRRQFPLCLLVFGRGYGTHPHATAEATEQRNQARHDCGTTDAAVHLSCFVWVKPAGRTLNQTKLGTSSDARATRAATGTQQHSERRSAAARRRTT